MNRYQASTSATIPAPPARVYEIIADYRRHHPRIVPPEYFRRLEVLEGGRGAGTRTRIEMRVLGATRVFEHVITEPEPRRVLVESDPAGSSATTFTVEDGGSGETTHLTIATVATARPGVAGLLERLLMPMLLRRIYRREIALLERYAAGAAALDAGPRPRQS